MVCEEYEIKLIISKQQYDKLLKIFPDSKLRAVEQTNYYYDTDNLDMNKQNTTVRIREKNGDLRATVKKHADGSTHSTERSFKVESIPLVLKIDGKKLKLFGRSYTRRTEINICDGITLMLDLNQYWDVEDYELELEYVQDFKEKADGIMIVLKAVLDWTQISENPDSKSKRFFKTFSTQSM